ncbi:MAG: DUF488 domain-containing protein [Chloroflexi bacterium]|nr:DUF488 domain-containing protein [Chloroflexota bacterium]
MASFPSLSLPTPSKAVQKRNKSAWNHERDLSRADFFTIGYEGTRIEEFVRTLKATGVATVVDIRHGAVSIHKPEFSKGHLQQVLGSYGVDYIHRPELGVPRDIRAKAAGKVDRRSIWEWYDHEVVPQFVGRSLHVFMNWADHPVALMCVEADPTLCHRHRLTVALERRGLRSYDL